MQFSKRLYSTVPLAFDKWQPRTSSKIAPIIFLHGLFGCKLNNRSAAKMLSQKLKTTVYCLDLRNHGDSPSCEPHTYKTMAEDVKRFILEQNLNEPTVIGHSMGAKTAMQLALSNPDLVGKCIPVDNAPISLRLSPDFGRYVQGMMVVDKKECKHQSEMFKALEPYCKDLPVQQFLLSNFKKNGDVYKCRLPLPILAKSLGYVSDFSDFDGTDARFSKPTLLIRGTKSNFVPDECLPRMGELFPRFVVRDIDSGHWVISEKMKEFVDEVVMFLDEE